MGDRLVLDTEVKLDGRSWGCCCEERGRLWSTPEALLLCWP